MSNTHSISVDVLTSRFSYEPETGVFRYKIDAGPRVKKGQVAGGQNGGGYICIQINRVKYKAHRLAWAYVHGVWPDGKIDYINGNGMDNRIANLRCVSHAENHQNRKTANAGTLVGLLGVDFKQGRYRARITKNGRQHDLGRFDTAAAAHAAYVEAKRDLHPFGTL